MAEHEAEAKPAGKSKARKAGKANPSVETLDEVIADLAERVAQLSRMIDERVDKTDDTAEVVKLFALHSQAASRLGRLLRDRRALSGDAADGLSGLVAQAIDEIATETGWQI